MSASVEQAIRRVRREADAAARAEKKAAAASRRRVRRIKESVRVLEERCQELGIQLDTSDIDLGGHSRDGNSTQH